jgi:hypothetical protein
MAPKVEAGFRTGPCEKENMSMAAKKWKPVFGQIMRGKN